MIQFDNITKTFGGVTALGGVSLSIAQGECHALVGENGAGKSTLGKILAGIHRPDSGVLRLGGQPVRFHSPLDAARAGVGMVHQELSFCRDLSVAENLSLGRYPTRLGFWLDGRAMADQARRLLAEIGASIQLLRDCLRDFHGTLLLDCELNLISELLEMPSLQPDYRARRPHGEFVTNLNLPAEKVKAALAKEWHATGELKHPPLAEIKKLAREKYSAREWNFKF